MPDLLTPAGLARFGEVAAAHLGDDRVPGMVVLVARGGPGASGGAGLAVDWRSRGSDTQRERLLTLLSRLGTKLQGPGGLVYPNPIGVSPPEPA